MLGKMVTQFPMGYSPGYQDNPNIGHAADGDTDYEDAVRTSSSPFSITSLVLPGCTVYQHQTQLILPANIGLSNHHANYSSEQEIGLLTLPANNAE